MASTIEAPDLAAYIKEQRQQSSKDEDGPATQVADDTSKQLPPLNKEGAWAAVGFAVVLIVLGLPVWWRTTTVYRAPLPYSAVQNLAGLRRLHYVPITIMAKKLPVGMDLSTGLKTALKRHSDMRYHVHARGFTKVQDVAMRQAQTMDALVSEMVASTPFHSGTLAVLLLPSMDRAKQLMPGGHLMHVTRHNLLLVAPDADAVAVADVLSAMAVDGPRQDTAVVAPHSPTTGRPPTLPPHKVVSEPSYSLTITLMLPQPHLTVAHWRPQEAVDAYLSPLLRQLEGIQMRVSVRCQQLYMTPLSGVRPQWQQQEQYYAVPHHQLPLAINAIEAKLGSFVSTDPALHFIVYVPGQDHSPLHIHAPDDTPLPSNSFVVPRWGGVIIQNPPDPDVNSTATMNPSDSGSAALPLRFPLDSHSVMTTILSQLHSLLPVPQIRPSATVSVAPPESPELAKWQLDALMRARVTQYYQATTTTLQSLHELVGEISNMVVSDEVGGWVWHSVTEWEACGDATQEGRLKEAALYCGEAHKFAQAAFFHPSMLALLYFPDNQKYAIYVPLFLPVSIPVLLSFKMLFSLFKSYWGKEKMS